MTLYVNLRASAWGAVCDPYVLVGEGTVAPPAMTSLAWEALPYLVKGKDVLLAVHGFNVSYESGVLSLAQLEAALNIGRGEVFLGVLWPGDWVVPAVNYPFEDGVASHGGALLGGFCNRWLKPAASISFLSHSLGARVILQAIKSSNRKVRRACITAGAVNASCLTAEYKAAALNCGEIRTLSSMKDLVLKLAYPPGDLVADALDPDHTPFEPALGRGGPRSPYEATVQPFEIDDASDYDHSNYFPPAVPGIAPPGKWTLAVKFMAEAFRGEQPAWP